MLHDCCGKFVRFIPSIGPVRVEFILFALTLIGVALFHKKTMYVALTGLVSRTDL